MTFKKLLHALNARRMIIVLTLLTTVAATMIVSLLLPKTYRATTSLLLNYKGIDPVTGSTLPTQLMPGYIATQIEIIRSQNVALKVVDELGLVDTAIAGEVLDAEIGGGEVRNQLAVLLLKNLDVTPARDSSVLAISFSGAHPQFAAVVANAFAAEYQKTTVHLKSEPLNKASAYLNEQIKALRLNLETAQNQLSMYQKEHGIVSTDNRLDVETARLNELSAQHVMVQGQLMDAASRQRQAKQNANNAPDVVGNPLIQSLKISLSQAEAKFSQIAQRLSTKHPEYQAAKAEVEKLRSQLEINIATTSNSIENNVRILQQRESELRAVAAAQKLRVLELNRARDELAVRAKEVESAQRAYDTTMQRFNQTSLEGQANQTDVALLDAAIPPEKPSSPRLLLNTVLSTVFGGLLGLAFGLLAETLDRRVRSAGDLAELLDAPVFGLITVQTVRRRRLSSSVTLLPRPVAS